MRAIGQDQNAYCLPCHTVGSNGLNADPALDNGGYDETAVARLAGVQCENCHGPGSAHPSDFASVGITKDAALCVGCHNGIHHPTGDEWDSSAHAQVIEAEALEHELREVPQRPLFGRSTSTIRRTTPRLADNPTEVAPVTCVVCHDPHGNDNPGNLRDASVTDRVAAQRRARRDGRRRAPLHGLPQRAPHRTPDVDDQIDNGTAHFGPHHSVQGDMLAGVNAYQGVATRLPVVDEPAHPGRRTPA